MTYLVIDLGSSSVRTLLFTDSARLIDGAVCSRKHDFHTDSDGRAEADAVQLQALTESCIDDILQHPAAASIRAVGMASFVGNWLGVDAQGKACTPVFTYADTPGPLADSQSAGKTARRCRFLSSSNRLHVASRLLAGAVCLAPGYSLRNGITDPSPVRYRRISVSAMVRARGALELLGGELVRLVGYAWNDMARALPAADGGRGSVQKVASARRF